MADVLIRGIEMPCNTEGCEVIIRIQPNGEVLDAHKIHIGATAVPLPEGHGKLGDLDKIVSFIDYYEMPMDRSENPFKALNAVRNYICNVSNTIVPAEEGNTDGN